MPDVKDTVAVTELQVRMQAERSRFQFQISAS